MHLSRCIGRVEATAFRAMGGRFFVRHEMQLRNIWESANSEKEKLPSARLHMEHMLLYLIRFRKMSLKSARAP